MVNLYGRATRVPPKRKRKNPIYKNNKRFVEKENEQWIAFTQGPGKTYEVSDLGRIRLLSNDVYKEVQLPKPNKDGYIRIYLGLGAGNYKQVYVHRIVAESFCPIIPDCNYVKHLDDNKLNNCADNLIWTMKDSPSNCTKLKSISYISKTTGQVRHKAAKLSIGDLNQIITMLREGKRTQRQIAALFNVTHQYISRLKNKWFIYINGEAIPFNQLPIEQE